MYDRQWYGSKKQINQFPWPVTGLSLNSRGFHRHRPEAPAEWKKLVPETWLAADNFRGIAVLDELAEQQIPQINSRASVVRFPDFADSEPCDRNSELPKQVGLRAEDRPVVSLLGSIHPRKGTKTLLDLIENEANRDLFFVIAGSIAWNAYDRSEGDRLRSLIAGSTKNALVCDRRIAEQEFNGMLAASQVVYANYEQFPDSSNMLSKAALFEKPLLVSDGYCIAARTKKFRLGEVVMAGNSNAAINAIRKMLKPDYLAERRPDWNQLLADHSADQLPQKFEQLFERI